MPNRKWKWNRYSYNILHLGLGVQDFEFFSVCTISLYWKSALNIVKRLIQNIYHEFMNIKSLRVKNYLELYLKIPKFELLNQIV